MTVAELKRLSPEKRSSLFQDTPEPTYTPINTESETIDLVVNRYSSTKIPRDDIEVLKKELSEIGA